MIRIAVRLLILPHRRLRLEWPCALAAAILLLHVNPGSHLAHGQCQYEIIGEIKGPDCGLLGVPQTRARGMNNHGHVVGDRDDCFDLDATHVFVWKQETGRVDLPTPANVFQAFGRDINDDGFIVGEHDILGPTGIRAFVWNPNTEEYTYLDPVFPDWGHSFVSSINNEGIAAGRRTITADAPSIQSAYLWNVHTGEVTDLGVPHGQHSIGMDVDESQTAAGWSGSTAWFSAQNLAYVWVDGRQIALGTLRGAEASWAEAANASSWIVGGSGNGLGSAFRGFLWRDGVMMELIPPPPYTHFRAEDIADMGQIVGRLSPGSDPGLWQKGKFHLLTDHIVSTPPTISSINAAIAVNNNGVIVAEAVLFGAGQQAVVLKPVDVPTGDLDFDCKVGVPDLLTLLNQLFTPGSNPSADLNGDGIVNVLDILILLQNWSPQ